MDFNSLIIILNNALLLQFYKRYRKLVKSIISQIKDKPKHNQGRKMSNTRGLNLGRLTEDYDSNKWAMRTFDSKLFKAKNQEKEWIVYKTKKVFSIHQSVLSTLKNQQIMLKNKKRRWKNSEVFVSIQWRPVVTTDVRICVGHCGYGLFIIAENLFFTFYLR